MGINKDQYTEYEQQKHKRAKYRRNINPKINEERTIPKRRTAILRFADFDDSKAED